MIWYEGMCIWRCVLGQLVLNTTSAYALRYTSPVQTKKKQTNNKTFLAFGVCSNKSKLKMDHRMQWCTFHTGAWHDTFSLGDQHCTRVEGGEEEEGETKIIT